jgi:hypothetical protein
MRIARLVDPPSVSTATVARNDRAVAGLRIAVGVLFLLFGQYKVLGRIFVWGGGFEGWIRRFLADGGAYPWMALVLALCFGAFAIGDQERVWSVRTWWP